MQVVAVLLSFLLGLIWGSFLNVVALRTLSGESIFYPSSHCPNCGHRLRWYENIPLLSWVVQRGRCTVCGKRISWLYPFGELTTALLFAWAAYAAWDEPAAIGRFIFYVVLISLFMTVTVSDLQSMRIPNRILLFFTPLIVALKLYLDGLQVLFPILLGIIVYGGLFFLIYWLSRGGMGMGDVKYAALLGVVLPVQHILLFILLASLYGLLVAIVLMLVRGWGRKDALPFGPFMSLSAWLVVLYGETMMNVYLSFWKI
ncbi:MAG: prepilin peptidase [Candidatus Carbobacillus altaicus]|nr:prepilin peptidase [Candidatus Carbobacillus altaicus]